MKQPPAKTSLEVGNKCCQCGKEYQIYGKCICDDCDMENTEKALADQKDKIREWIKNTFNCDEFLEDNLKEFEELI
jgi:hypothetical protein